MLIDRGSQKVHKISLRCFRSRTFERSWNDSIAARILAVTAVNRVMPNRPRLCDGMAAKEEYSCRKPHSLSEPAAHRKVVHASSAP